MSRGLVADVSDRVQLELTGADRVRYLNGQVTSNVTRLAPGQTQPACVTTAKGRLCAEVFITATADALLIDADASLRESLPARLERYIVADDVMLSEAASGTRLIHLIGGDSSAFADFPLVAARRFGIDGWDLRIAPDELPHSLLQLIDAHFTPLDEPAQETLRIERGIPRWGSELDENTLPPEAGLDRTHVDFHKGCYIGQEVISRIKSVGHVNRELVGFVSQGAPLTSGMTIFSDTAPEKSAGTITSAAWSLALEKSIALGYLKRGTAMHGLTARSATADAPVIAQALPFVS